MAKRDFYDILGVDKTVKAEDLKKAYRKLAMKYHPDRNPGDTEAEHAFKEVNEAYDILKDDQKRAAYDRFGHAAFDGGMGAGPHARGAAGGRGFEFSDIFDEMFGEFMGGRRGQAQSGRGSDIRFDLEITLEEAHKGKSATVNVPSSIPCEPCKGTGAEAGSQPTSCPTCNGAGRVRASQGFFTIERTCPACGGAGKVIKNPCKSCGGSGRTRRDRTLQVNIPAGVDDGTRIRLAGEGEAGLRGAPPGDLYIFLAVKTHRIFQRDGADLHCRVPIPMTRAALGGAIEVPTIDGASAKINIPSGTQAGAQFRLRAKGMSVLRSASRGDLYVQIQVETPVNLTRRQRELLEEFERESPASKTSPESEGFFARVKDFFDDLGKG